jgi:hypothetical protein
MLFGGNRGLKLVDDDERTSMTDSSFKKDDILGALLKSNNSNSNRRPRLALGLGDSMTSFDSDHVSSDQTTSSMADSMAAQTPEELSSRIAPQRGIATEKSSRSLFASPESPQPAPQPQLVPQPQERSLSHALHRTTSEPTSLSMFSHEESPNSLFRQSVEDSHSLSMFSDENSASFFPEDDEMSPSLHAKQPVDIDIHSTDWFPSTSDGFPSGFVTEPDDDPVVLLADERKSSGTSKGVSAANSSSRTSEQMMIARRKSSKDVLVEDPDRSRGPRRSARRSSNEDPNEQAGAPTTPRSSHRRRRENSETKQRIDMSKAEEAAKKDRSGSRSYRSSHPRSQSTRVSRPKSHDRDTIECILENFLEDPKRLMTSSKKLTSTSTSKASAHSSEHSSHDQPSRSVPSVDGSAANQLLGDVGFPEPYVPSPDNSGRSSSRSSSTFKSPPSRRKDRKCASLEKFIDDDAAGAGRPALTSTTGTPHSDGKERRRSKSKSRHRRTLEAQEDSLVSPSSAPVYGSEAFASLSSRYARASSDRHQKHLIPKLHHSPDSSQPPDPPAAAWELREQERNSPPRKRKPPVKQAAGKQLDVSFHTVSKDWDWEPEVWEPSSGRIKEEEEEDGQAGFGSPVIHRKRFSMDHSPSEEDNGDHSINNMHPPTAWELREHEKDSPPPSQTAKPHLAIFLDEKSPRKNNDWNLEQPERSVVSAPAMDEEEDVVLFGTTGGPSVVHRTKSMGRPPRAQRKPPTRPRRATSTTNRSSTKPRGGGGEYPVSPKDVVEAFDVPSAFRSTNTSKQHEFRSPGGEQRKSQRSKERKGAVRDSLFRCLETEGGDAEQDLFF